VGPDFVFTLSFIKKMSQHKNFGEHKKLWVLSPNAPRGYGPAQQWQKITKILKQTNSKT